MFPWITFRACYECICRWFMHYWGWQQHPKRKCTTTTSSSLPQNIPYNSLWDYQLCQHLPFYYCIFWCSSCVRIYFLNFTHLNIEEALFLLYDPFQLFWNHTDVVYRSGIIHTSFNKVGTFWTPFRDCFIRCPPGINMLLLWIQFIFF